MTHPHRGGVQRSSVCSIAKFSWNRSLAPLLVLTVMIVSACNRDTTPDDHLRRVLEAESSLAVTPPGGRSRGPVRVAEPTDFGDVTGRLTPLQVTHEIEVPDGQLLDVMNFFMTHAIADGFDPPVVSCTDLHDGVSVAHLITTTKRDGEAVGLHVSARRQDGGSVTALVAVYDAEDQSDDPSGTNRRPCEDPTSTP